jgi:hypothetical protein
VIAANLTAGHRVSFSVSHAVTASANPGDRGFISATDDETTRLCPCGYDLRGLAAASRCPECGRPIDDALAHFAWDFPLAQLLKVRLGIGLTLAYFFAFSPAFAVFIWLPIVHRPLRPAAWLIPPIVLTAGTTLLTRPWPGMTHRDRQIIACLRLLTLVLLVLLVARYSYELRLLFPYPFVYRIKDMLSGMIAVVGIFWSRRLCHCLADLAHRLDCWPLAWACYVAWCLLALGWAASSLPFAVCAACGQWRCFQSIWSHFNDCFRFIDDFGGFVLWLAIPVVMLLLLVYLVLLNLAVCGIDHRLKLRTSRLRQTW